MFSIPQKIDIAGFFDFNIGANQRQFQIQRCCNDHSVEWVPNKRQFEGLENRIDTQIFYREILMAVELLHPIIETLFYPNFSGFKYAETFGKHNRGNVDKCAAVSTFRPFEHLCRP